MESLEGITLKCKQWIQSGLGTAVKGLARSGSHGVEVEAWQVRSMQGRARTAKCNY